ncbi:MAG: DHH family phosphoesterase, partial [Ruminococcus sp.]|nr:DHH family phosphoesterase [Ruminococcus sp.]
SEEMARQALDMTQGRGGDQVAVKDDKDFAFFGGNSSGMEKSTKVKTRIFSTSLVSLIKNSENVIIMGHAWGDLDALGAASGLCGAVRAMGCSAYVYSDVEHTLAGAIIDRLKDNIDDETELFIDEETALDMMNENSLLIIVDTNSKELLDSKPLYEKAEKVVFIDHHRQVVNSIDNAVLSLHEPYASSASEMVAEVIQYFSMEWELSCYYADAMLAGIMLDTKDFVMKTGVRTFEAAAFLKKLGADTVAVKQLFAISAETGIKRSQLIETSEIYRRCAIALSADGSGDIRVAAAQAADELLSFRGVDASFVIFPAGKGTNISARSFGAMNVQIIMERLGGGGHQTSAAVQLADVSAENAKAMLMGAVDEYVESIS